MPSLYDWFMKPLEKRGIRTARKRLMKLVKGSVLEIGSGTGANIPFYNMDEIDQLVITDKKLSKHIDVYRELEKVELVETSVTSLPYKDQSFDTIVHTLVFCSVDDVMKGLSELKRVLKPGGKLMFIEHVLPHKKGYRRLFKTINPIWRTFAGGCNLTRSYEESLITSGFQIEQVNRFMSTVFISGIATKKT